MRYRFLRKNYATLRGGLFQRAFNFRDIFIALPIYAFGAEYSRQSIVGPLRVAAQWCNITGFTTYASIGFTF